MSKTSHKDLLAIHEDVPASHYDEGIKNNLLLKFYHSKRFSEVIRELEPAETVLDLGCHSGLFTEKIIKSVNPVSLYGLDISHQAIKLAKKRIKMGNFVVGDAHNVPYDSNFFHAVFCLEMLEHIDDPQQVLREIKRVLKKGGYGIILVPTESKLFKIVWAIWTSYNPVWKHAHVQSFTNDILLKMIERLGLKIEKEKKFHLGMLQLIKFRKIK